MVFRKLGNTASKQPGSLWLLGGYTVCKFKKFPRALWKKSKFWNIASMGKVVAMQHRWLIKYEKRFQQNIRGWHLTLTVTQIHPMTYGQGQGYRF